MESTIRPEIPPGKGNVRWVLIKAVVGLAVVLVIYWKVRSGGGRFSDIQGFAWHPVVLCVLLLPVNLLLDIQVWRILLAGAGVALPLPEATRAVLAGFPAAAVSPGGVGDFLGRVVRIPADKRWITGIAMALGRAADGAILCIAGFFSALLVLPLTTGATNAWIVVVLAITVPLTVVLLVVYFARGNTRWLPVWLRRWPSLLRALELATTIPARVRLRAFGLATLRYVVFATQFVLALLAFGVGNVKPGLLMLGVSTVYLLRNVAPPLTFMGLGIREAASVAVLGPLGVPEQSALLAALVVFVVNLALPALIGIPYLLTSRAGEVTDG